MLSTTQYQVYYDLSDGRELKIEFSVTHWPGTFWEPPVEEVNDSCYWIDNKMVEENDLPNEVTDDVLEQLYHNAKPIKVNNELE